MSQNLLFIDTRLATPDLLAALPADYQHILLDTQQDGLQQIISTLDNLSGLASIQLLVHGSAGGLQLGNRWIGRSELTSLVAQWQAIGSHLGEGGDLLLYACDLANGEDGAQRISTLASLTGADVAASSDLTGSGGDWDLEVRSGRIEATTLDLGTLAGTLLALYGTSAAETLNGSSSDDTLYGGAGDDKLHGLDGNDYLYDGGGRNLLEGGNGNDTLYGSTGIDTLRGGSGDDQLAGAEAADYLDGGYGNDTLWGGSDNDRLIGAGGNDTLYGEAGTDSLYGGDGNDFLYDTSSNGLFDGGAGDDNFYSGDGRDTQLGGDGNDTLSAGTGNDSLDGGAGNDVLYAGAGDDTLIGSGGDDTLWGGDGNDVYYIDSLEDRIYDNDTGNTLYVEVDDYLAPTDLGTVIHAEGVRQLPYFINSLCSRYSWGPTGSGYNVTYSFIQTDTGQYSGFTPISDTVKTAIRAALAQYSAVTGLTFTELADDDTSAATSFYLHDMEPGVGGYASYTGDVHLINTLTGDSSDTYLLLHEIGHAMGLKHPFEAPALPASEDTQTNTVMTYNLEWPTPTALGTFDLAALHYLYGVSSTARATNNLYTLNNHYVWDGAGTDTLSAAAYSLDAVIDLTPGSWNYVNSQLGSIFNAAQSFLGFGSWIENAFGGSGNDRLTGNRLANSLTGNAGMDTLSGGDGSDSLIGGQGDDTYILQAGDAADLITEAAAGGTDSVQAACSYSLADQLENLLLTGSAAINASGNALANQLGGNSAANTLDGGAGADTLSGGAGDDCYVLDDAGDVVIELADGGSDTLYSSLSRTLGSYQENLILTGSAAISATGNELANQLTGNEAANTLDGGLGADTLSGGAGDDSYVLDDVADEVIELADGGNDTLYSNLSRTLGAYQEHLILTGSAAISATGNALANQLGGNEAANTLDGGIGADTLSGGAGNDSYVLDDAGDVVIELADGGSDTLYSSLSRTLGSYQENLILTGSAAISATGNELANQLGGNSAANTLDGGSGADTLRGGDGNDRYQVDNSSDVIVETSTGGSDLVYSSVSFVLASNVEQLILSGSASINATGNALANNLTGNAGANRLNGLAGADTLRGGDGNDTYYIDSSADVVVESSASTGGLDTLYSSVTRTLGSYQENLALTGTAIINATGNALANRLTGNAAANQLTALGGDDTLSGAAGNDTLTGGAGRDALSGGAGNDLFDFNSLSESGLASTTRDVITDFVRGSDRIDLSGLDANSVLSGDQAFTTFISATATFNSAGQLKLLSGVLYANTDSDSSAEFSIALTGITALALGDLVA